MAAELVSIAPYGLPVYRQWRIAARNVDRAVRG